MLVGKMTSGIVLKLRADHEHLCFECDTIITSTEAYVFYYC